MEIDVTGPFGSGPTGGAVAEAFDRVAEDAAPAGLVVFGYDYAWIGLKRIKGASVLAFRDKPLRNSQYFFMTDWTGGKYASPGIEGSRSGGILASAGSRRGKRALPPSKATWCGTFVETETTPGR